MAEIILKFPLFYLPNKEIQSRKIQIQNQIYFKSSCPGFPHSEDKRAGILKLFLPFFNLFLYIAWELV